MIDLSIIVPVYNEEDNIKPFLVRLKETLKKITDNYEIIFCLDPSKDSSENLILQETINDRRIKLLTFSRRFGQPTATMAGIKNSSGERCVIIDCDLQDPPELINDMYLKMNNGFEVVTAQRLSRKGETVIKKILTKVGYYVINKISDVPIPKNTGDFRIISKKVVDELKKINDKTAFLRGLVAYIGFETTYILYNRDERYNGKSKYNIYLGSLKIALNGVIGFSSKPLFAMSIIGFLFAILSFLIGLYYLILKIIGYNLTAGLSSTILLITFFSGLNLIGLGLLGEYVGRIYDAVKNRPEYIIKKKYNF